MNNPVGPKRKVWFEDLMWPKCFESREQFKNWHQAMMQSKIGVYSTWVCTDCTPSYQKKMMEAGRCENPHVQFKKEYENKSYGPARDDEWIIVGFVKEETYRQELERRKLEQAKFWEKFDRSSLS